MCLVSCLCCPSCLLTTRLVVDSQGNCGLFVLIIIELKGTTLFMYSVHSHNVFITATSVMNQLETKHATPDAV